MSHAIDLFWSFRSPYSYIATPQILQIPEKYNVEVRLRLVLPAAIRNPALFKAGNENHIRYLLMDWQRRAKMLGLPHAWPSPDPIVQDLNTLEISTEQPYIYRLTYLGVEARRRGKGLEFISEVSRIIFGGTRDWHLGDHLERAAERAGLNLTEMEEAISDPDSHLKEIEKNHTMLDNAGHWGVPTFTFNNEPFFGQDRIDSLHFQLEADGLKR